MVAAGSGLKVALSLDGYPRWRPVAAYNLAVDSVMTAGITGGSGNINNGGTQSITFNFRTMRAGQTSTFSETATGTYVRNGNANVFRRN